MKEKERKEKKRKENKKEKVVVETVNAHNPEDSFSDRFINLLQK